MSVLLEGLSADVEEERQRAAARAALGDEAFARAWDEGRARAPDHTIECALEVAATPGA